MRGDAATPLTLYALSVMESLDNSFTKGRDSMTETGNYNFKYVSLSDMASSIPTFFHAVARLRRELGDKAHLADEYIEMLCDASNAMYPAEIAEDGFDAGRELHGICRDIVEGKNSMRSNPFHETAARYIKAHPIEQGDISTRTWIYLIALYGDYLEYAVNEYSAHMDAKAAHELHGRSITDMRETIMNAVDPDDGVSVFSSMEFSYNEFFSVMPSLALYLRGAAYQFIDGLMHVDADTKRRVYQIILDNLPPESE